MKVSVLGIFKARTLMLLAVRGWLPLQTNPRFFFLSCFFPFSFLSIPTKFNRISITKELLCNNLRSPISPSYWSSYSSFVSKPLIPRKNFHSSWFDRETCPPLLLLWRFSLYYRLEMRSFPNPFPILLSE